ncbi:hypothetical protein EFL72_08040 [Weissella cibaria]|nr:hypothetical protein [Weissella cibaria]
MDLFNDIHHTLDKFVEVKAVCIRAPRILYPGYLEAFGRHRGKPLDPFMLTPFKDQIIKHHVEQYLNQSLRIACKALSLDTPPTIPLLGLIGVFR